MLSIFSLIILHWNIGYVLMCEPEKLTFNGNSKPLNLLTPKISSNSPYCLLYNSYGVSLKNLELDLPIIP